MIKLLQLLKSIDAISNVRGLIFTHLLVSNMMTTNSYVPSKKDKDELEEGSVLCVTETIVKCYIMTVGLWFSFPINKIFHNRKYIDENLHLFARHHLCSAN